MDAITLKELIDGIQVVAVFCGSLLSIVAFFHFALVRPIKRFLQREVVANLVDINNSIQANTSKLDDHIANGGHYHGDSIQ
jgi:hypothetical protein